MNPNPNWKSKTWLIGGGLGLLTGLFAAYLLIKSNEEYGESPRLTAGDGTKIGMGVVALLKLISDLGRR